MNERAIMILAVCIFAAAYFCILILPKYRAFVALGAALLMITLGIVPFNKVFSTINWNVLLMIAGTMGLVALFIDSKMPALLGDIIIARTPNTKWAIVSLSIFAGLVSAFVDNVATVLMLAPIALNIAKKLNISPVPAIIAISISSNLQGAATLVGDTTSILLGGQAGLTFFDFFVFLGKPGMFWVVQVSAALSAVFLLFYFRKEKQKIELTEEKTKVTDYFPTILMLGVIVLLITASFIPEQYKPSVTNGLICVGLFLIGVIRLLFKKNKELIKKTFKELDYFTLLLLAGLFIVVGGISEAGVIKVFSEMIAGLSGNIFVLYTVIVFVSVILSAFIDNIPYVATMLPVAEGIASILGMPPYLLYFGLLSGATLGGNLTPIGASANIASLGILKKEGYTVKAKEFMKMSVPFTLIAVLSGYLMIWFIWS